MKFVLTSRLMVHPERMHPNPIKRWPLAELRFTIDDHDVVMRILQGEDALDVTNWPFVKKSVVYLDGIYAGNVLKKQGSYLQIEVLDWAVFIDSSDEIRISGRNPVDLLIRGWLRRL